MIIRKVSLLLPKNFAKKNHKYLACVTRLFFSRYNSERNTYSINL